MNVVLSKELRVRNELKPGDTLFLLLFNQVLKHLVRQEQEQKIDSEPGGGVEYRFESSRVC